MTAKIKIIQDDITAQQVEAIVNAANNSLLGGGGVDGAIHRAAGGELLEECRELGGCPTGEARITKGYRLSARWIIHTVGPIWQDGEQREEEELASCYRSVYDLVAEHGIKTVAFPAISTGVYRFPITRAATIAVEETHAFLAENQGIKEVRFVCFDRVNYSAYQEALSG